jgi:hypothetical protein
VKSLPLSEYKASGIPQHCQCGSVFRQIAWRSASAVCSADGASNENANPMIARL